MSENINLNSLFQRYWNDYQEGNTIGLAYEAQLREQCDLNEGLDSLKELDGFLTAIRRDVQLKLTKANLDLDNKGTKKLLLEKKEFCNLLLFIGFYTGHVLAKQHNVQAKFFTQAELQAIDKQFTNDDFIYSMAVMYAKDEKATLAEPITKMNKPWLFFVYEPMVMRLCGGYDYQLTAIQGQKKITDSLYQSVFERLPKVEVKNPNTKKTTVNKSMDIYSVLLTELETIPVKQTQAVEQYEKAKTVMAKFDDFAKKQNKHPSKIKFNDTQTKVCQQALNVIKHCAELGNTTAMLHLAVYSMRGDWLEKNITKGVELIKQSANAQDKRAMNTLSKMYYQGIDDVLPRNTELGKQWLEIASKGGHPDARKIHYEMKKAEMMIDERNKEIETDKKYIYFFSVLAVFILLIIIFL